MLWFGDQNAKDRILALQLVEGSPFARHCSEHFQTLSHLTPNNPLNYYYHSLL